MHTYRGLRNISRLLVTAIIAPISTAMFAQTVDRAVRPPVAIQKEPAPGEGMQARNVPGIEAPAFSQQEIDQLSLPPHETRVGAVRVLPVAPELVGGWAINASGQRFWSVRIQVPGAIGLRLHFEGFSIGSGRVWIGGNVSGAMRWFGPYSDQGLLKTGDFWTETVFSDSVEVEYLPASAADAVPFHIGEAFQWWKLLQPNRPSAARPGLFRDANRPLAINFPYGCYKDESCFDGYSYINEISKGTAYIIIGDKTCTGTFINDNNSSFLPLFLTAGHCVSTPSEASMVDAFFDYKTPGCADPTGAGGFVNPSLDPGQHQVSGATLITYSYLPAGAGSVNTSAPDFSFLLLSGVPDVQAFFAGWSGNSQIGDHVYSVSHPQNLPQAFAEGNIVSEQGTHDDFFLVSFNQGTTDHGSSGSGLFDQTDHLVGVDSYEPSASQYACDDTTHSAGYTRFSSIYPQIQDYLTDTKAPVRPTISSFSASQGTITAGHSVTLSWTVLYATTVTIDHSVGTVNAKSGTATVSPASTTTYTLTATNSAGTVTQTATVTVQGNQVTPPAAVLPHFAVGGGFVSDIYAVNTGAQAANFSIAFYDNDGKPAEVPYGQSKISVLSDTVPAHGTKFYELGTANGASVGGSATVANDASINIQALFRRHGSDGSYYEAGVPVTTGSNEVEVPFDATKFSGNGSQIYTGLAIANMDISKQANVTCTARDSNGNVVPNAITVAPLNPLGHFANYLFPALTGLRGYIDCTSNARIGAMGIRALGNNGISSLPAAVPR